MLPGVAIYMTERVFGIPLIVYGGAFTLICFVITAAIAILTMKGIKRFPLKWHTTMAYISLALGLFHGVVGILTFF
jgi:succinate dehydrogenase hydrophobic anchor subunit